METKFEKSVVDLGDAVLPPITYPKIEIRKGILVRFIPATNYKPCRWCVSVDGFKRSYFGSDSLSAGEAAQVWIYLNKLEWEIGAGAFIPGVGYVFTLR